ncbi:MAG TPA: hypothetical protein VF221_03700 [Chloroflexota bacterium]
MRPDPQEQREHDGSGRIIYLGDVRRRRGSRRQSPDRHYLAALAVIALAAWAAWAIVLLTLPPSKLLTYLAFFAPLSLAVGATGALAAYLVAFRRTGDDSLVAAVRRGVLLAAVVVVNLACLAAHHWSVYVGVLSAVAAVFLDVFATRRG